MLDADLRMCRSIPRATCLPYPVHRIHDLSHSMRFGRTPQQFIECFNQALPNLLAAKNDTVIVDVLVHTTVTAAGLCLAYGEIAKLCAKRDDIWVTTRGQIAKHFLAALG